MATIVLSAVGTAIGGPLGGLAGALLGRELDAQLFRPSAREGRRLAELAITTSSYGSPIPRHFGAMRAPGTIIWATDLIETSERSGGGKGQPETLGYNYSANFAVALASRPIRAIGRIWADGGLLRGAAGDLKVPGLFRFHSGHGDQAPDPLIASAEGPSCPAFRGIAYCVFEGLHLASFGNRIPALSFEVLADEGEVDFSAVMAPLPVPATGNRELAGLVGFSDQGGPLRATLEALAEVYPMTCATNGARLEFQAENPAGVPAMTLPHAAIDPTGEGFGASAGRTLRRQTDTGGIPAGLRYYDVARDYQAGLQHAGGRAGTGQPSIMEFPGALEAHTARRLAQAAALRQGALRTSLQWRIAELDPQLRPGTLVRVPGLGGVWRVAGWEWRETGIELDLVRQGHGAVPALETEAGRSLPPIDRIATPTILQAYELPWDGHGNSGTPQIFAAASSATAGWNGAALYADSGGSLQLLRTSGSRRSLIGTLATALPPGNPFLLNRAAFIEVELVSEDFLLSSQTPDGLAAGANRALLGEEIIQFAQAAPLGSRRWRLSGLLRGRGGTEPLARASTPAGAGFVLLDDAPVRLSADAVGNAQTLAAIGLADAGAVLAPIRARGATLRPLMPVHPRILAGSDASLTLSWTRRARGAFAWNTTVERPLVEQAQAFEVGLGDPAQPILAWQVSEPRLRLGPETTGPIMSQWPGQPLWVRQIGTHDRSAALFLTTISQG